MERVLSDEEKFRKAQEIYNRRKNINVTVPSSTVNRNLPKRDLKKVKKMLLQIGICILIYFSVYVIQYSNYYFSNDFVKKVEQILAYDINFNEKYSQFKEFIKGNNFFYIFTFFNNGEQETKVPIVENTVLQDNTLQNTVFENQLNDDTIVQNNLDSSSIVPENDNVVKNDDKPAEFSTLGTGGGINENINSDEIQMRLDAETVKNTYEITLPLRGKITSRYGIREIEPKFHTGIDIARDTGSEIISAISGKVILVDEQVSYGKVLKIQNNELVILYAHCNDILVKVGDEIKMMQKVATVGSTGNSTGPHLHLEIIYCGRYINPEYVLEFKE